MLQQQQNLGRRFGTSQMHLIPLHPTLKWLRLLSFRFFVDPLLIVTPIVGFCNNSVLSCALLSFAIVLIGMREPVALLILSSCCLDVTLPPGAWGFLQFVPIMIWASTRENLSSVGCEQQRHRPACASAQSDQRLCYSLIGKYHI